MKVILLILLVAIFVGACFLRYNRKLKEKAKKCSEGAKQFHKRLEELSDPSRVFTDEEVRKLKIQFAPLLDTVNSLYDSHFISNEYLDKLGLGDFMEERKLLNHTQFVNNQQHPS
ncbi:MAG: hypothetical protein IJK08_01295 [Prevotella sp.]|jgi:hypothetical protein|nr:hypothetical protein [Prevotella sp.]